MYKQQVSRLYRPSLRHFGVYPVAAIGAALSLSSAALLLFRSYCEPVVRIVAPLLMGHRSGYRYDPSDYYYWVGLLAAMTTLWLGLSLWAFLKQPAEASRIDRALKSKLTPSARGAPLEPN
ncbi:hypothetical protein ACFOMD_16185 [Sphingoaurantiacus capsulatus]|uniref:Uncharacterized protein n=1 Tax=Sphingoaurantiacus capsulatus TaxID=1771310 RepID=A0ABV7XDU2_9SPHN